MASALSPSSALLPNTAAFLAVFPTLAGLTALVAPAAGLGLFDIAVPASQSEAKLPLNLMRLFGIRDIYLGTTTVAAWYFGDRRMLGVCCLLGGAVVTVDGIVQKAQTGAGEWKHWGFMPVMTGLGLALVGALDGLF